MPFSKVKKVEKWIKPRYSKFGKQRAREIAELRIMQWLNRNGLHSTNTCYHCGNLGILHIYWKGSWVTRWLEIQECPVELEKSNGTHS